MGFTSSRIQRPLERSVGPMDGLITARSALNRDNSPAVTYDSVAGVPAIQFAVEVVSEAIAQLRMGVWRGENPRVRVSDVWQARLFAQRPCPDQNEFDFWHTISASLEYRGNAYIWRTRNDRGQIIARTALHPGQVMPSWLGRGPGINYTVTFQYGCPLPPDVSGYGTVDVGPDVILHIRGRGTVGELVAPTPVQRFHRSLGLAVGKQEYEASLLANGAGKGVVIKFPKGVTAEEGDAWREKWDERNAGANRAGITKVIGGGAEVSDISMTQADAQFVQSYELTMRDMCLIFHVPEWLLGVSVSNKSRSPGKPEHEMQNWRVYYLGPRLSRIESAFNDDPFFFGGGDLKCAFDASDIVRGDLETEDRIAHQQIQDGRLLPDEWRVPRGMPPVPKVTKDTPPGMIPQITPVGGAPNKSLVTAPADSEEDDD